VIARFLQFISGEAELFFLHRVQHLKSVHACEEIYFCCCLLSRQARRPNRIQIINTLKIASPLLTAGIAVPVRLM
jgi:hypothetical protein